MYCILIVVGLNKRHGRFLNFKVSPEVIHLNKPISSSGKMRRQVSL